MTSCGVWGHGLVLCNQGQPDINAMSSRSPASTLSVALYNVCKGSSSGTRGLGQGQPAIKDSRLISNRIKYSRLSSRISIHSTRPAARQQSAAAAAQVDTSRSSHMEVGVA